MPNACVLTLGTSDVIGIISALVAVLSALFASQAAAEAKRANELALLSHRKAAYDAFFELKKHMEQRGSRPEMEQVSKFYYPSRDAAFYFKESLSGEIKKYFDLCFRIADLARLGNGLHPIETEEIKESFKQAQELAEKIDESLTTAVKLHAANG